MRHLLLGVFLLLLAAPAWAGWESDRGSNPGTNEDGQWCGDIDAFESSDFTMAVWFKVDTAGSEHQRAGRTAFQGVGFSDGCILDHGRVDCFMSRTPTPNAHFACSDSSTAGACNNVCETAEEWCFVVVSYEDGRAGNDGRIYIGNESTTVAEIATYTEADDGGATRSTTADYEVGFVGNDDLAVARFMWIDEVVLDANDARRLQFGSLGDWNSFGTPATRILLDTFGDNTVDSDDIGGGAVATRGTGSQCEKFLATGATRSTEAGIEHPSIPLW